ncbi:CAP domain-containing protein [Cytobacillus sp. FSL W7-1323]|uniref:CAP domain-containing protein n=1 Tax=unclassified Cytobacillus TaxID=2675268 RepID=UPI002AFDFA90|nr:CAP domain-containing protein [Cytobacillus sp. OWB-43]MEA1854806.1 CAP domain-containing protein [Cytobacillus sp. OWB-43]
MLTANGVTYLTAGENIAKGYTSPKAVVQGWMNSEGHRANILNGNFTEIGIRLWKVMIIIG